MIITVMVFLVFILVTKVIAITPRGYAPCPRLTGWARTRCWPAGWPSTTPSQKVRLCRIYCHIWRLVMAKYDAMAKGQSIQNTNINISIFSNGSKIVTNTNKCWKGIPWEDFFRISRLFEDRFFLDLTPWSVSREKPISLRNLFGFGSKGIGALLSMGLSGPTLDRR